jgi:hypothetical protein
MTVRLSMLVLAAPLAALGCSDPPPPLARGSVEVYLRTPASTIPGIGSRTSCTTAGDSGSYTYFLGKGTSATNDPLVNVQNGLREHGAGHSVSCTVKALGSGRFSVSASVGGVDANVRKAGTVSLRVDGTLSADGQPSDNAAQVSFYSPDTTSLRTISDLPGCTIYPVSIVKDGALLAKFSCPVLADSSDTAKGCEATGAIAIERCRTGKEED